MPAGTSSPFFSPLAQAASALSPRTTRLTSPGQSTKRISNSINDGAVFPCWPPIVRVERISTLVSKCWAFARQPMIAGSAINPNRQPAINRLCCMLICSAISNPSNEAGRRHDGNGQHRHGDARHHEYFVLVTLLDQEHPPRGQHAERERNIDAQHQLVCPSQVAGRRELLH